MMEVVVIIVVVDTKMKVKVGFGGWLGGAVAVVIWVVMVIIIG
jgi:hypothetical protein